MTYCKNLEDGTENLPNSLKDLRMSGTAFKSLPESIWEMKYLEILILKDCTNLRKISEISNQVKCLSEILLSGAEIEELPEAIEGLTLLEYLDLNRCYKIKFLPKNLCELSVLRQLSLCECSSLEELPPLPRGLDELKIMKCERLKSIAELPSSLRFLYANHCRSLETISSPGSPPKPPFRHSLCGYWFADCLKLDEDTRNNVIADRARLLSLSRQDDGKYSHRFMYPGDEIPEWFSYQTDGGNSINIHLPPNWFELPFRFAFCIVFNMFYNEINLLDFTIRYEFNFKTNTSNSDDHLHNYDRITGVGAASIVDLDHVFIVGEALYPRDLSKMFGPNWSSMCSNITEASFRVSSTNQEYDHVDTIKKFGFRFCNAD
ncbi:disease resistance protein RPP2B-like isoform X1 [Ziziphus jujuba]|uniref:Disease resistance protein RPP2B-like isoform X1 n=1 Tax=Ziziphus jujuba TaxID=326968 RepID=A0A6P3YV75_ZIZJJ|nr:disease resistance protein RPP2B-like isoform X1 [Ziziphus jujuba]XP_060674167.1 disease resistance protein RPP2B-like isoform X1 [Ziziphus jujuba]XP_060674168.1 disease resistance protein RPP2B-like isoform X1 [Ziziphus jujuba]